jgi:hypothetical protein
VHDALRTHALRCLDHVARTADVHADELLHAPVLVDDRGGVDDEVAALQGAFDRRGVGDVHLGQIDLDGLVTVRAQPLARGRTDEPLRTRDGDLAHGRGR